MRKNNQILIAHRGASSICPENTLISIKKAIDLGFDMVEVDVHQTKDNRIVVIHDKTISRTTNDRGRVSNLTLKELRQYSAGIWFDKKFIDEKIPTLEEVLKITNKKIKLLIEIKDTKSVDIEKNLANIIKKNNSQDYCIVQSFNLKHLENINKIDNKIEIHKLMIGRLFGNVYFDTTLRIFNIDKYKFIKSINVYHRFVTKRFIDYIHKKNKNVFVWTVDSKKMKSKLFRKGVDGIITNKI